MKTIRSIFIFAILILLNGCYDDENPILVKNNSDKAIYVSYSDKQDTAFEHIPNPLYNKQTHKVEAYSLQKKFYGIPSKGWFDARYDTLLVFVFDARVIETVEWKTIREKNMVLKKYFLSLADLERMNWVINYP